MVEGVGASLRNRREELGLSSAEVASALGLDRAAFAALEEGRRHAVLRPPLGATYLSAYATLLDAYERGEALPRARVGAAPVTPSVPGEGTPTFFGSERPSQAGTDAGRATRLTEGVTYGGEAAPTWPDIELAERAAAPPAAEGLGWSQVRRLASASVVLAVLLLVVMLVVELRSPGFFTAEPVEVRVQLQRNAHLKVWVDGALVDDRDFAGRAEGKWVGQREVALEVPAVEVVRIWFGDRVIEPRGRVGTPRRLVFLPGAAEVP